MQQLPNFGNNAPNGAGWGGGISAKPHTKGPPKLPTKPVARLKTAKALGLTVSPTLLARAEEVIE